MRPLPHLPFTTADDIPQWSNFHNTIVNRPVAALLTPGAAAPPAGTSMASAQAQALNAILQFCMTDPVEPICTIGARWSLSDILSPANVVLDPGTWNQIVAVDDSVLSPAYKAAAKPGRRPVVVQGGTNIRVLNNFLGGFGLALQTSGASDGHRIAGCIATGTHGAHVKVGAVHDTVLGVFLVTGPNQAIFLQPSNRTFLPGMAQAFETNAGIPTQDKPDDDLFNAARVALGGLGFVHSVIVETEPLYQLSGLTAALPLQDPAVDKILVSLDTSAVSPVPSPDFVQIIFSPYAETGPGAKVAPPGAFVTLLWKRTPNGPFAPASSVPSALATDLSRLLSALIPVGDAALPGVIGSIVAAETTAQYPAGPHQPAFPGTVFGPTNLPEGNGRSSELVVDQKDAKRAVGTVIATLQSEGNAGRHLLGGIGVRFVPGTTALLGANIHPMNTYIEFPSLNDSNTSAIHAAVWNALGAANIPFTCHWGQENAMTPASIAAYFGADRIQRWKAARNVILATPAAKAVFTNPLLTRLGLA